MNTNPSHWIWLVLLAPALVAAPGDENWERFPLPEGLNGTVIRMLSAGDKLYAGGAFTEADGRAANGIAVWKGSNWSPVVPGLKGYVFALAADGEKLYIGGSFIVPEIGATNLVMWDGSRWKSPGAVIRRNPSCSSLAAIYALACQDRRLFVGGGFDTAGDLSATNIAVWDGHDWGTLGSGIGGSCDDNGFGLVYAITARGKKLYAGGLFHRAGEAPATNVACWDGTKWSALGTDFNSGPSEYITYEDNIPVRYSGAVYDLQFRGTDLYAAGEFSKAGTNFVGGIAVWDGQHWLAVGGGVQFADNRYAATVSQVLFDGSGLIVMGSFDRAGTVPAANLARWDGKQWSPLGQGVSAQAAAATFWKGDLFVGGTFGIAGDEQAPFAARWNGTAWHALHSGPGAGVFGYVTGVAGVEDAIFCGRTVVFRWQRARPKCGGLERQPLVQSRRGCCGQGRIRCGTEI